jgi:hypothetical protein
MVGRFSRRLTTHSLSRTTEQALLLALSCASLSGCKLNFFGAKNSSFVFQDKTMHDTNFQLPASSLQGSGNLSPAEMGLNLIAQCYHYTNGNPVNEKAIRFGTLVRDLRLESPGLAQALLGVYAGINGATVAPFAGGAAIGALNMRRTMDAKMLQGLEDIGRAGVTDDDSIWKLLYVRTDQASPSQYFFVRRASGTGGSGAIPVELAYKDAAGVVKTKLDLIQAQSL